MVYVPISTALNLYCCQRRLYTDGPSKIYFKQIEHTLSSLQCYLFNFNLSFIIVYKQNFHETTYFYSKLMSVILIYDIYLCNHIYKILSQRMTFH